MERYIPVAQTRPKPPRVWLLLVQTTKIYQSYCLCYHLTGSQIIPDETKNTSYDRGGTVSVY